MHNKEWQALLEHQKVLGKVNLRTLFAENPNRVETFSATSESLLLDFSKNYITAETLTLLSNLAKACKLDTAIEALFKGESVNYTENKPALHTALRIRSQTELTVKGSDIIPEIKKVQHRMSLLSQRLHAGELLGFTQKPITHIVNIGIGGSELGPKLITEALSSYKNPQLTCDFISNIDGQCLWDLFQKVNPETTLWIISSKSFSTTETLMNATTVREWFKNFFPEEVAFAKHFIAVTANKKNAMDFGFKEEAIYELWDWVGGRFSLWSSIGLSAALYIGMEHFQALLSGAAAMDDHFRNKPFLENLPVLLALLSIWYQNFYGATNQAVIPYLEKLKSLPAFLQQLFMESQGKSVNQKGEFISAYHTGAILWGSVGCNAQHTFHQLLHQGTHLIPCDFIVAVNAHHTLTKHQEYLFASCISQSQALMQGKTLEEAMAELIASGMSAEAAKTLAPHKTIRGNQPSNTLLFNKLTPYTLGELLALYEHKVYAQSVIWDINPFDQWGIELGKELLQKLLADFSKRNNAISYDASTQHLYDSYFRLLERS